jgi:DNA-binding HxlR family transcriptional regulator
VKRADNRSDCPVNFGVEVFGDSWSLLIVRDMVTVGKRTFGEFLQSDERIGSSVLAARLAALESNGIIIRASDDADGRKVIYSPTAAGRSALPLIYELQVWGTMTNPATDSHPAWYEAMALPRETVMSAWRSAIDAGDSFYFGERSVVRGLGLSFP